MSCLNEQTSRQTVLGVRHKHTTAVFDEDQHHTQNSTKKISTWMKYFTIYWLVLQYFTCLWWTYLNGVVWAISILQTSHTLYGPNKKKIKQLSVKNIFQMMLIWQCLFTQVCVCVCYLHFVLSENGCQSPVMTAMSQHITRPDITHVSCVRQEKKTSKLDR